LTLVGESVNGFLNSDYDFDETSGRLDIWFESEDVDEFWTRFTETINGEDVTSLRMKTVANVAGSTAAGAASDDTIAVSAEFNFIFLDDTVLDCSQNVLLHGEKDTNGDIRPWEFTYDILDFGETAVPMTIPGVKVKSSIDTCPFSTQVEYLNADYEWHVLLAKDDVITLNLDKDTMSIDVAFTQEYYLDTLYDVFVNTVEMPT
jgi:hypothetical protein